MALNCGIIGLTNTGKTTIFNCMSKTKAEISNYAFSATKSNKGIVDVPDPRLYKIDEFIKAEKVIPATVEIVDVPGLAKGSSQGEGVGNKFLADIQQTDALIHVLRCFEDENLSHIEGSIDPVRDMEIVDFELQVRDLDLIERKIERLQKLVRASGDTATKKEVATLEIYKNHLENFGNARTAPVDEADSHVIKEIQLLTAKPVIYVCNVDDASATKGNKYVEAVQQQLAETNEAALIIAGELEAEIADLDEEDREVFLEDAGLEEPGVNKLIRGAYDILNLQAFFTAGPKEVRAWTIKKGMKAPQAAGVIHSDLERGFIRSEVMKYADFIAFGSEQAVKDAGKFHVEGKNYVVEDADIMHIRFNV